MPDYRGADGNYHDPVATLSLHRLRRTAAQPPRSRQEPSRRDRRPSCSTRLSWSASTTSPTSGTSPETSRSPTPRRRRPSSFLQELLTYVRSQNLWILGFDRPDVLALAGNPDLRRSLAEAVDVRDAVSPHDLPAHRSPGHLADQERCDGRACWRPSARDGETPLIVTPASVPGWERRLGSIVSYESTRGPIPLLVNDVIAAVVPGGSSVVSLRQRILSDAALAGLQRAIDPTSRADAVTIVDPTWNPGPGRRDAWTRRGLRLHRSPAARRSTTILTRQVSKYDGHVPTSIDGRDRQPCTARSPPPTSPTPARRSDLDRHRRRRVSTEHTPARSPASWACAGASDPPLGISVANNQAVACSRRALQDPDRGPAVGDPVELVGRIPADDHQRHHPRRTSGRRPRLQQPGA